MSKNSLQLKAKRYFNIERSSKEFKSLLKRYKDDIQNSKKSEDLQKLLDLKKLQVERSETEEEYMIREMKNNQLLLEEMKNTYGKNALSHANKSDLKNLQSKVSGKAKLEKEKFFNYNMSPTYNENLFLTPNKKKTKHIFLPLIFPQNKSKLSICQSKKSIHSRSKLSMSDSSQISIRPLKSNRKYYLEALDSIRNEYRSLSEEIKETDEQNNDYYQMNQKKIRSIQRHLN